MPQLDPTWFASQLFWLAVTFVVLYVLISKVLLPPIAGVMATRKSAIDGDITTSERLKKEAEAAKASYEEALTEARANSRKIMDDMMAEHQEKADKATAEMQDKIAAKLAEAEKSIAQKRESMLADIKPMADEMATLITKQMTGKA